MKVSLNLVQQLINFELPSIGEVAARVNAQLGGIEEITNLGDKYKDARVVRIVSCEKHPNADKLSVCWVDDGGVVDVPRNDKGLVQVVCGAPNVKADMWAVWLPPKATVPASFADAEPFVLDARKLRGVLSQGMLAAGDELDLNDDHDGIIEIHESDLPSGAELRTGASFAEVFGLDGYVIDIENKMFTHRPDCFGQLGVAREIAGIFGRQFTSPEWYSVAQEFAAADGLELVVKNEARHKVPRFMAVAIDNVTVGPSPLWLQCQLIAMGGKPINNIVDATNYVMYMTGQPTHAYDYDALRGGQLIARMARDGETVRLLNDKEYTLDANDIVIADAQGVIGLGGIMGGAESEVSENTTRIVLECANFDMYTVRKTAMKRGVFTDALARFNKGQSPLQNAAVLRYLMDLVGGKQASPVYDEKAFTDQFDDYFNGRYTSANTEITSQFINQRLGSQLSEAEICQLLGYVEIESHGPEEERGRICVSVPFWRTDIELSEDIVEEVGRLYGFEKLPRQLPMRSMQAVPKNLRRALKQAVRQSLSRAGANEVLTYSFVHERVLTRAEQSPEQAFRLLNALSPDLQYYRLTVLPSLLDKVHANIKAGHGEFVLFEMGKGHCVAEAAGDDGLPIEQQMTDIVYAAKQPGNGAPFYKMRRIVWQLSRDLGAAVIFRQITTRLEHPVAAPFDQGRSALVETADGVFVGIVGELKQSVIKNFKLPQYTAAASLDTAALEQLFTTRTAHYQPLSRFPSTSRDVSLKVAATTPYAALYDTVRQAAQAARDDITVQLQPIAVYQPSDEPSAKTITLRFTMTGHQRTLTEADITPIMNASTQAAIDHCGAELA